ncbi:hypothetical protein H0H92_007411 [Tricholoma furcatifolium]|nr:hypothetical protein H0H92_007411 [Tricholoma furcatifolium]
MTAIPTLVAPTQPTSPPRQAKQMTKSSVQAPLQSQMKACNSKKRAQPISNSDLESDSSQSGDMSAPPSKKQKIDSINHLNDDANSKNNKGLGSMHTLSRGSFRLYATSLPFLQTALESTGSGSERNYPALLAKIQEFQAKKDCTAQIFLDLPECTTESGNGVLESKNDTFTDPAEEEPFAVHISDLQRSKNITSLPTHKAMHPKRKSAIVKGTLGLGPHCGINSANGEIRMRVDPVWVGGSSGAHAIYEGHIKFDVRYGSLYSKMGFGKGSKVGFGFWAVRDGEGDAPLTMPKLTGLVGN